MKRGADVQSRVKRSSRRAQPYELARLVKELEWLRTLAHTAPVAIFRADARGICTYVNERWSELTGLPARSALGAGWQVGIHPEDIPLIEAEWRRCLEERLPFRCKHRCLQPSGRIVWILSEVAREVDGRGKPAGYTGMMTDVTELRQMREELQRSNQKLELRVRGRVAELQRMARIVEALDDAVMSADRDGRVLSWNRGAEAIFGYTAAEMIGQSVFALAPGPKLAEAQRFEDDIRHGTEIRRFETTALKKGGVEIEMAISGFPLRDAEGEIAGTWAIMRDITQRKRAERALRDSDRLQALIINSINDCLWLVDVEDDERYRFRMVNDTFERVTGLTRAEVLDRPMEEWFPQGSLDLVKGKYREVVATCRPVHYEETTELPAGLRVGEISVTPIVDGSGRCVRLLGTAHDITARKSAERMLQQLSRQLMKVQDEERRRIARELHDSTAQMLAALGMNLAVLARENSPLAENRKRELLRDSLALAEQATGELRTTAYLLHPPLLEERGLPAALAWLANGFAERSGIQVRLEIAPDFARPSIEVEMALFRVAQESLHNVHRHSGSKSAEIRLFRNGSVITFEARDHGSGPPPNPDRAVGVGIAGMRERLLQLGGALTIEPNHPGTAVIATLPATA